MNMCNSIHSIHAGIIEYYSHNFIIIPPSFLASLSFYLLPNLLVPFWLLLIAFSLLLSSLSALQLGFCLTSLPPHSHCFSFFSSFAFYDLFACALFFTFFAINFNCFSSIFILRHSFAVTSALPAPAGSQQPVWHLPPSASPFFPRPPVAPFIVAVSPCSTLSRAPKLN